MKRYVVTLEKDERAELAGITRKGSHQSQKVLNALILLNSDEGEFNEHRARGGGHCRDPAHQCAQGGSGQEAFCRGGHGRRQSAVGRVAVPATCARPTASSRRAWWR